MKVSPEAIAVAKFQLRAFVFRCSSVSVSSAMRSQSMLMLNFPAACEVVACVVVSTKKYLLVGSKAHEYYLHRWFSRTQADQGPIVTLSIILIFKLILR